MNTSSGGPTSVAYLGPSGTFTEEALFSQPDLAVLTHTLCRSIPEVLESTANGVVSLGFTAIENSIEGSVNVALDALIFEHDLLIQREVVIDVKLHLLAQPGAELDQITQVISFPVATAQCRHYLKTHLTHIEEIAANSTAAAVQQLAATKNLNSAAIGTSLSQQLYGLETLVNDIADHTDNQTRFVAVAKNNTPPPSGNDKTSIVIFQRADRSGSLMGILAEFAARSINLTKLESRPTKKALGDYCFLIDLEGHISDELVADCLISIMAKHGELKFLGSYPSASSKSTPLDVDASKAWTDAQGWMDKLRSQVHSK